MNKKKMSFEELKSAIENSSLFDKSYYLKHNKDARLSTETAIDHFCKVGIKEDRKPNEDFEPAWYKEYYKDIQENNMYPVEHYLLIGNKQNKFMSEYEKDAYTILQNSQLFDINYYLETYEDLQHQDDHFDSILHFIRMGAKELRNPCVLFDTKFYLDTNLDVKTTGINPLVHYILHGEKEGRLTSHKNGETITIPEIKISDSDHKSSDFNSTVKEAFDSKFYLDNNPDLKEVESTPFEHYIRYGWKERRSPTDWFNITEYLRENIDIDKAGIEPFSHYLLYGKAENRKLKLTDNMLYTFPKDPIALEYIPRLNMDEKNNLYADYKENHKLETAIKTIAFYLPQFHPFPENDKWWGKGFTEWTNVTKAQPNYVGHYQPHLPIHYGFYDLRVEEVMIEQTKLAKNYGIYGFNYYYYWFDGKILMDLPLKNMLKNKKIDMPFCLTWANENWTRRWDGAEHDVLMAQKHSEKDSIAFIHNLFEYFHDERYIRVDNKPMLIVYRADIIPDLKQMISIWKNEALKAGFEGLYIICAQTFGTTTPEEFDFDASMEFPPHTVMSHLVNEEKEIINSDYTGQIYDYSTTVKSAVAQEEPSYDLYRTAMLGWDNTARKQNNSNIFADYSTYKFKQWISHLANTAYNNDKYNDKFVFINAWNEWAEGTHLEPDRKYGYSALDTVHEVVRQYDLNIIKNLYPAKKIEQRSDIAVILHLHYTDMWEEINSYLENFGDIKFDLYISITDSEENIVDRILRIFPNANIFLFENRGRDIYPLIQIMKLILDLDYVTVCKVHSKKSLYREDGSQIKDELYTSLLGSKKIIESNIKFFKSNQNTGLLIPSKYNIPHTEKNMKYCNDIVSILENIFEVKYESSSFPAGSMYWFKPEALKQLCHIESKHIPVEDGWSDGTVMHAIERYIEILVKHNNYTVNLV